MNQEIVVNAFNKVLNDFRNIIDDSALYENVFKGLQIKNVENNKIYLSCTNKFSENLIKNTYQKQLCDKINSELNSDYVLVFGEENNEIKTNNKKNNGINSKFTFSNYVINSHNKLAFSAAKQIINENKYNPIFFLGRVGVGKTHLLYAIGNEFTDTFPNKTIKYINAEEFVRNIYDSLSNQTIENFKKIYGSLDMLLVDDIQYFDKKEKISEIFFSILNQMLSNNKTVIIASDKIIDELPFFDDRMRSRLSMGLILNIESPDINEVKEIIKNKIKQNYSTYTFDDCALNYIANRSNGDIRTLEGILNTIIFNAELLEMQQKVITQDFVKSVIANFDVKNFKINPKIIIEKICSFLNISKEKVISLTKEKKSSDIRYICMYFIKQKIPNITYKEIGSYFSSRSHVSVIEAMEKANTYFKKNNQLKDEIEKILNKI